jgi:hypothetical protein
MEALVPADLALLMKVNFGYQWARKTPRVARAGESFPIVKLLEIGDDLPAVDGAKLDFAILQVGRASDGKLPGDQYRVANLDASLARLDGVKHVTVIQHPNRKPKKVAAGSMVGVDGPHIRYKNVDTHDSSSGAGVIDQDGFLVGVHTVGGCDAFGGTNGGVTLNAIARVSSLVK